MFTDIGFTGDSAGYGMMYTADKKTSKTDNEDIDRGYSAAGGDTRGCD